jgi:hypothetical protein
MPWAMQVTLLDQRQWYQCACEGALPAFLWLTGLSGWLQCSSSVSDGVFVDWRGCVCGTAIDVVLLANSSPLSPPTDYCTRIAFSL